LEHFIRYQLIAGVCQVDPVPCQDTRFLVPGVVLQLVIMKNLPQVDKVAMELLGQIADHLRIGVEIAILPIGEIRLSPDDGRSTKAGSDMSVQQFVDDGDIEFFELIDVRSCPGRYLLPDIIDANVDEYDIRILR